MADEVILRVVKGPMTGAVFSFREHDTFVFGRGRSCHACITDDTAVSRHHFVLEADPPRVRIRDLGSRNGTRVNGKRVGGRPGGAGGDARAGESRAVDLGNGDEIRAGKTVLRVEVTSSAQRAEARTAPVAAVTPPRPAAARCKSCGVVVRDVTSGAGAATVCDACRDRDAPRPRLPSVEGYELVTCLGTGGMGAVYLARRQRDSVWLALKVLLSQAAANETARGRFERECGLVGQLTHENIVGFAERGAEGDVFWFAMEFCPLGSVADLMKRRGGKLPLGEAAPVALGVLEGLAYAHAREVVVTLADGTSRTVRGVVHRDVKPRNMLLAGSEGRWVPKLSDFGLAKCFQTAGLSGCTLTGDTAGDLSYMPREQLLEFRTVTPASDVWSMGASLYAMLTGVPPRDESRRREALEAVLESPVVPIRTRSPEVPESVAAVIDRALDLDVAARYPTAAEFRDALAAAL